MSAENRDIQAAWQYHQGTKHPGGFLLNAWHRFGPADQPRLYKRYLGVDAVPLPLDQEARSLPALQAIATQVQAGGLPRIPAIEDLARLLYYSAGVTKTIHYPGYGDMHFRAAACTGALYHIELYVVCGELPGLAAGVYHFDAIARSLHPLRQGDFRGVVVQASGKAPGLENVPLFILYSDVFWRNAVKYQARAYRHSFWDSGTMLANSLALCSGLNLPAQVVTGFADPLLNQLLGLDGEREAVVAMLAAGQAQDHSLPAVPALDPLHLEIEPDKVPEKVFPAITDIHQASSLLDEAQVTAWRTASSRGTDEQPAASSKDWLALDVPQRVPADALEPVIIRRGSTRRFARQSISLSELSTLLHSATRGIPFDFTGRLNQIYLIVHAVEGLAAGQYIYHPEGGGLELLNEGSRRGEAGHLALGQALAAEASLNVYFLVDLPAVLHRFGSRGYRLAQLEAAVMAGKMYLAAYALRRGATGLTFQDDEVTTFFSTHAQGKSVMFLIALGVPARRS